jgi:hypothetical protein
MTEDFISAETELALPGDKIRERHIATRASNRRRIIILMVGDAEFEGYSIGLDGHSLQLLELPSGEVSSLALAFIVAITDGKPFNALTPEEKDTVDRRTASFRKTSQSWLVSNWPKVYDRRDDDDSPYHNRPRMPRRQIRPRVEYGQVAGDVFEVERRLNHDADSQVRD